MISDKSAGLYGSFYSIGMIISPIMGSLIYEHFREVDDTNAFNKTCDVFALLTIVYTVLYVLVNVLPDIRNDKEQQRNMSVDGIHDRPHGSVYSNLAPDYNKHKRKKRTRYLKSLQA